MPQKYCNLRASLSITQQIRYHEAVSKVTTSKDLLNIKRHFASNKASKSCFSHMRLYSKRLIIFIILTQRTPQRKVDETTDIIQHRFPFFISLTKLSGCSSERAALINKVRECVFRNSLYNCTNNFQKN